MIYWFTGQPGAGKSTLAAALKAVLQKRGHSVVHFDGEEIREITGNDDYSEVGRVINIRTGQRLAAKLDREGISVVASFVSPYRTMREEFKKNLRVVEVYVHTTAIRGREKYFVRDYEPPLANFLDIDTTDATVEECIEKILVVCSQ